MMAGIVLIVDDNEHLTTIAALTLRSHGYEIVEATTEQEAIEKTLTSIRISSYSILILQIRGEPK
jgi:CheY-like chemotaxis protein